MTGTILGYDPGGNGRHGLALLGVADGVPQSLDVSTHPTVESVLGVVASGRFLAVGVDTLTCWSTGRSGWRPADRWLRARYPAASRSVVCPNSLYGSMSLGGMAVLLALRRADDGLLITEAHPKVVYRAFWSRHYDYVAEARAMDADLAGALEIDVRTANDHEWDAAVSAFAAWCRLSGEWSLDLHQLPVADGERLIEPCGPTQFAWPE